MFRGFGTVVNVTTVLVGSGIGVLLGHRLPQRTRDVVTDALGLVTLLVAALSAFAVTDPVLSDAVGDSAPVLIVLGSLLIGGIAGSLLRIEFRLERLGGWLQRRFVHADDSDERRRFIEGFVAASMLFCIGPLTMLGLVVGRSRQRCGPAHPQVDPGRLRRDRVRGDRSAGASRRRRSSSASCRAR